MRNVLEMINYEKNKGYNEANATAKVCQDIVLEAIAMSSLSRNITIKGGVVMRSKTKDMRRATQDLDIDFIRYSIANQSLDLFIQQLNCIPDITISRAGDIEELKQQDYHGKRIYVQIEDTYDNKLNSKIDVGVHKKFEIEQEEYCFDIALNNEGANLLINSNEQMFTEKLRSLLKFGPASTRYKDIFDIYYLIDKIDKGKLEICLETYKFQDDGMRENNSSDILKRVQMTFNNRTYQRRIATSDKKWLDEEIEQIFEKIIEFHVSLVKVAV